MLITNNNRQFSDTRLHEFCKQYEIEHRFTLLSHPQANGEVEVINRTLLQGLKAKIARTEGSWVDELHHVLWIHQTTQRLPTSETPFNLTFETETVISVEFELASLRVEEYNEDTNFVWF